MVRRHYSNGYIEELQVPCMYFRTPRQARRWAINSVTGNSADMDVTHTEYFHTDADGVESVETFYNTKTRWGK